MQTRIMRLLYVKLPAVFLSINGRKERWTGRRGLHIGKKLVKDYIVKAKEAGFRILQFNAVVAINIHARHLYEKPGFKPLGTIPGGFRLGSCLYEDIYPYYIVL